MCTSPPITIRFGFGSFWLLSSLLTAVGAAFSLYSFIVRQAAANPAAWQHHGIYHSRGSTQTRPYLLPTASVSVLSKAACRPQLQPLPAKQTDNQSRQKSSAQLK